MQNATHPVSSDWSRGSCDPNRTSEHYPLTVFQLELVKKFSSHKEPLGKKRGELFISRDQGSESYS